MASLNERALRQQLEAEGFTTTYSWQDGANAFYPEHTHSSETAHIILDGDLALTMNGSTQFIAQAIVAMSRLAPSIRPVWGRGVAGT